MDSLTKWQTLHRQDSQTFHFMHRAQAKSTSCFGYPTVGQFKIHKSFLFIWPSHCACAVLTDLEVGILDFGQKREATAGACLVMTLIHNTMKTWCISYSILDPESSRRRQNIKSGALQKVQKHQHTNENIFLWHYGKLFNSELRLCHVCSKNNVFLDCWVLTSWGRKIQPTL